MTKNIIKPGATLKPGFKNWIEFLNKHVENKGGASSGKKKGNTK